MEMLKETNVAKIMTTNGIPSNPAIVIIEKKKISCTKRYNGQLAKLKNKDLVDDSYSDLL